MKTTLVTTALATFCALTLSACGGSNAGVSGVNAIPNTQSPATHRMHHQDNGPQDLHAGGADVPDFAYTLGSQPVGTYNQNQPGPAAGSLFYSAPTTGTIYYCLTSSTDGRKAFEGEGDSGFPPTGPCAALGAAATGFGGRQDPLDFVATAVALASTECCGSSTPYAQGRLTGSVQWGQPFEFPQIGAPIVFGYRLEDFSANVSSIKLSTWTYCAIANGTISDWNDPAITADNGTSVTGGTSEPITFYFRADSAASTNNFENHLNTACNVTWKKPYNKLPYQGAGHSAAWTFGVGNTWAGPGSSGDPNPNYIGEQGDPGILAAIQATPFGTGYLGGAIVKAATNPKLGQAILQNGVRGGAPVWVDPSVRSSLVKSFKKVAASNIQYGGGSDGNPLGSSAPWCQLYIPATAYVNPPKGAYPIVAVSYLLFYGNNNGVHVSDKEKLINFLFSKKATNITNKLEFVPLSTSVKTAVINALNGNGGSQPACLQ